MKPFIRVTVPVACLALLLWGGVAVPAETSPVPESPEYLMGVVEAYPSWGVADVVASDQMDAAMELAYGGSEAERERVVPGEPVLAEVSPPEIGSYEQSVAMETGNLPSACAGEPCPTEQFTLIETGGVLYRLEVDVGGN